VEPGTRCVAITKRGRRCKNRATPWPLCRQHWNVLRRRLDSVPLIYRSDEGAPFQIVTDPPEEVTAEHVWALKIDEAAHRREDPEWGRAWAWRCILVEEYPELAYAAAGGYSEWKDVGVLLSDAEAAGVEASYSDDDLPVPERWDHKGLPEPTLPPSNYVALIEYGPMLHRSDGEPIGRRVGLAVVEKEGPEPSFSLLRLAEGVRGVARGAPVGQPLEHDDDARVIAEYHSPADIIRAVSRALPTDGPLAEFDLFRIYADPELRYWHGRVSTLSDAWEAYYAPFAGVEPDDARRWRDEAGEEFRRTLAMMFPLAHRQNPRAVPVMRDVAAVYAELCSLMERIESDAMMDSAAAIRTKFRVLLPRSPDLAEEAARVGGHSHTARGRALVMLARWQGIDTKTMRNHRRRWS